MKIQYSLYIKLYKIAENCNTFDEFQKCFSAKQKKEDGITEEMLSDIWHIVKSSPADFCGSNKTVDLERLGKNLGINDRTIKSWVWNRKHIPDLTRLFVGYIFMTNEEIKKN